MMMVIIFARYYLANIIIVALGLNLRRQQHLSFAALIWNSSGATNDCTLDAQIYLRHTCTCTCTWTLFTMRDAEQPADGAAQNSETTSIQRITVKQGSRLRLECRTDAAKPHAEVSFEV